MTDSPHSRLCWRCGLYLSLEDSNKEKSRENQTDFGTHFCTLIEINKAHNWNARLIRPIFCQFDMRINIYPRQSCHFSAHLRRQASSKSEPERGKIRPFSLPYRRVYTLIRTRRSNPKPANAKNGQFRMKIWPICMLTCFSAKRMVSFEYFSLFEAKFDSTLAIIWAMHGPTLKTDKIANWKPARKF